MNHEEEYKAFIEFMGGRVPNPEQHPVQFEHAVRTFLFVKNYHRNKNTSTSFQGG